jgi:hypothetical protein
VIADFDKLGGPAHGTVRGMCPLSSEKMTGTACSLAQFSKPARDSPGGMFTFQSSMKVGAAKADTVQMIV